MIKEKVSIIIPIYNAEKYLRQCLESIKNQTYTNFECLCVDNNSTDESLNIILEFTQRDNRFLYLQEVNPGPSAARNLGLDYVSGKYVIFIDADDYIDVEYLSTYINEIEETKADLVIGGYKFGANHILNFEKNNYSLVYNLVKGTGGVVWAKIYRSTLFDGIRFNLNLKMREDLEFNLRIAHIVQNIRYVDYCGYNYRDTAKSLSKKKEKQMELDSFAVKRIVYELESFEKKYIGEFLKPIIFWDAIYLVTNGNSIKVVSETEIFKKYKKQIRFNTLREIILYMPLYKGYIKIGNLIYRIYAEKIKGD